MPNYNQSFEGQTLILPGVYTADNVSATLPISPGTLNPLVFIGFGYGVKPLTPTNFTNGPQLQSAMRGAPSISFLQFMFNPSTELNGAQIVTFINVGENTQSSATLYNSTGIAEIDLYSVDYGEPSNLLQYEVQDGTIGGILLTLYDGYSGLTYSGNNLGIPFNVAYTGTATSGVSYSVIVSGGVATQFNVTSPNAGESFSIPLGPSTYATVQAIVEYLNGTGFYTANVLSNGLLPSTDLDSASDIALPVPSGGNYTYVNVTSTLPDVVFWVNTYANSIVSGSIAPTGISEPANKPAVANLTNFTGGRNIPPILSDYANGFNLALSIPAWVVFADSNSAGIIALGVQHALTASSITEGKPRRFVTGSSIGMTISQAVTQAQSMNAYQASFCYPGIYRVDTITGINTLFDGLHVGAAVAGMFCGNIVAQPVTNVSLIGTGTEVTLTTSNIDTLQQGGVMPLSFNNQTGVPFIVSDLTTWQNDNNPENGFNQQVACRQALHYDLVNTLQPYVGMIVAGTSSLIKVLNAIKAILNERTYTAQGSSGYIASWDPTTLQISYNSAGQIISVQVDVVFVNQARFITVYVPIQPLTATVTG